MKFKDILMHIGNAIMILIIIYISVIEPTVRGIARFGLIRFIGIVILSVIAIALLGLNSNDHH